MELACPSCGTRFRVPEGALGRQGRKVRCGACGHAWHALPEDAAQPFAPQGADDPLFGAAPAPATADFGGPRGGLAGGGFAGEGFPGEGVPPRYRGPGPALEERGGRRWGLLLGWLLFVLVIAALIGGGWQFRQEIVARVPETKRIYDLLGVPLAESGPPFVIDWKRAIRTEETGPTVTLSGQVINASEATQMAPQLVVILTDAGGRQIDSWAVEIGGGPLASGEARDFATKGPWPEQAADVLVRPLQ